MAAFYSSLFPHVCIYKFTHVKHTNLTQIDTVSIPNHIQIYIHSYKKLKIFGNFWHLICEEPNREGSWILRGLNNLSLIFKRLWLILLRSNLLFSLFWRAMAWRRDTILFLAILLALFNAKHPQQLLVCVSFVFGWGSPYNKCIIL